MEEQTKKSKLGLIIPIIVAIVLVAVFVYLDYKKPHTEPEDTDQTQEDPKEQKDKEAIRPQPISPSENPRREEELDPRLGCAGPVNIKPETLKEPDKEWIINKNGKTFASLGKYRITAPSYLVFDIPKIWLYFFSEKLSDRENNLYGLEQSYVSGISLIVNDFERKISLGGEKYMFIELDDFPFGDLYPYDREVVLDFEIIIELECNNLDKDTCLDNEGNSLNFINNADIQSQIRIFAVGCQEFTNDLVTDAIVKY